MDNYRLLTSEEIEVLEHNGCWAEDWTAIEVTDGFRATALRNVSFYGNIRMGAFEKQGIRQVMRHSQRDVA